jgi:nicotinamidase-related amidase
MIAARSPLLMNRDNSAVVVIDVQEKLVPHISGHERMLWNIGRLLDGARALGVKVFATEQYPRGLGKTVAAVAEKLEGPIPEKTMFSCRECIDLVARLKSENICHLVLVGIETHVCVAQTALDLMAAGFSVFVNVDAVGSRFEIDRDTALRRLEYSGATPTTTEAVLFEWCESADSTEFKAISKLVQQSGPRA